LTPTATATVNLNAPIEPGKVDFNEDSKPPKKNGASDGHEPDGGISAPRPAPPEMKVWDSRDKPASLSKAVDVVPSIIIPVNSGLDAVMLSGVNARQPGSSTGAAGASTSALNVGAPFVTRLKGDAILPNGWKLSQLGDCFLGGSAVAILSTERANAIADTLSCISPSGEVWEGPVKAYALDVDGTLGIAGKVVSKQGSLLMQAALAGLASGLGSALAPTGLPSYNGNAVSGQSQGYQLPNASLIAGSAVGQGVNTAAAQLSKFYLEFAREIFPVVEVVAGTRVTWILKESIELKKTYTQKVATK
jgi:conjugal transfer pilus assembly protein TraB